DHWSGQERGVFKTADGGKSWQKVLFKDAEMGVADLGSDPDNPNILYAALRRRREDPLNPAEKPGAEQNAAIYKSTDEGSTWNTVDGQGMPTEGMGGEGGS